MLFDFIGNSSKAFSFVFRLNFYLKVTVYNVNAINHVKFNVFFLCVFVFCKQGAGKEIREAIADPQQQYQEKAWNAVLPLVSKLRRCYEHSLELERVVPRLLSQLVG